MNFGHNKATRTHLKRPGWFPPLGNDPTETHTCFHQKMYLCDPRDSPGLLCPWESPGSCLLHILIWGISLTQRSNPGLLHCRQILYCPSHLGSPRTFIAVFNGQKLNNQDVHSQVTGHQAGACARRRSGSSGHGGPCCAPQCG